MAFLRKWIDKYTYMTISGIWVAGSVYLTSAISDPALKTFIVTAGSLIISWIGLETQTPQTPQTPQTQ